MKSWQIPFRMAPKKDHDAQGESTGDDDFRNEAEDDRLAQEGEEEVDEEEEEAEEEESEEESEEEQSEKDEDPEEEAEEETEGEEQEEEAPAEGRFKDKKTGDFDFKRINKALGGDFLEKRIKEQDSTITKNFQELKSYKDFGTPEKVKEFTEKSKFLDNLVDSNPIVQAEVFKALNMPLPAHLAARGNQAEKPKLPPGVHPDDPLAAVFLQQQQTIDSINNRFAMEERQQQQREGLAKIAAGVEGARAKFKELTGKTMSPEQAALVEQEMRTNGYLNGARFVPDLFFKEIMEAAQAKLVSKRVQKKKLPKTLGSRRPAPTRKKARHREDDREELWNSHMGNSTED